MLLTLGCYGFVYTNAIARGFALAQMLTLCGIASAAGRPAACWQGHASARRAAATTLPSSSRRRLHRYGRRHGVAVPAALPFLGLDAWFFAAQHASRPDQFPPFDALAEPACGWSEYQTATVFGGLPLYVDGVPRRIVAASRWPGCRCGWSWRVARAAAVWSAASRPIRLLLAAAVAPPAGLAAAGRCVQQHADRTALSVVRVPVHRAADRGAIPARLGRLTATLLIAWLASNSPRSPGCCSSPPPCSRPAPPRSRPAGCLGRRRRACAPRQRWRRHRRRVRYRGAARRCRFCWFGPRPAALTAPLHGYRRVVLALMAQDRDSIATIAASARRSAAPNWRRVAIGSNVEVYERSGKAD